MLTNWVIQRKEMVEQQLKPRGIVDPAVLRSLSLIPRHLFVPESMRSHAYADGPLKIGFEQTISQPYIVALMAQAAEVGEANSLLEIGTGSGYGAAVLSLIAKEVYTIERIPDLASEAERRFLELGYSNIHVRIADGTLGWPEKGPFDAIVVTAGAPEIPHALLEQLQVGGRMVVPVGDLYSQELIRVRKISSEEHTIENLGGVRFVPLIGEEGWKN